MRTVSRLAAIVSGGVVLATLAACGTTPVATYPVTTYPAQTVTTYPAQTTYPVAGIEYGRVTNVEYMPAGTTTTNRSALGAVVGGVAGALLGNQIGSGGGRAAATVLGGVAGAAIGSQIQRNSAGVTTTPGYRITMVTDQGVQRVYEVPATGDLRVGDRVRVDAGVIYRA
jgi:outer membrane lipoprotein SlyB